MFHHYVCKRSCDVMIIITTSYYLQHLGTQIDLPSNLAHLRQILYFKNASESFCNWPSYRQFCTTTKNGRYSCWQQHSAWIQFHFQPILSQLICHWTAFLLFLCRISYTRKPPVLACTESHLSSLQRSLQIIQLRINDLIMLILMETLNYIIW